MINDLSKRYYENLLILLSENQQYWILAIRPQNRPRRIIEVVWREDEDPQKLLEKIDGIFFDISEENDLHLTDVVDRVRDSFIVNSEKVTNRFYREFKSRLSEFCGFISGITIEINREWYAALMLNRLMFIYFLQKKFFLDGDKNYLRNRLIRIQEQYGENEFDKKFYRLFLRVLFSDGLGTPTKSRSKYLVNTLGKVPYLNGGLFDIHEIERENEDIEIPDRAFERLFDFFDKYNWHLDDRATASGKDINPDVIGYIFEKYINEKYVNERSKKGAYYTQEDITGYISRNTILPCLLDRVKESCESAFHSDNGIWRLLKESPDNYIYSSIRKGCHIPDKDIPNRIKKGLDIEKSGVVERRKFWNEETSEKFGLSRETWRDTIARRKRYFSLKRRIENGEINKVEDLVTYNLDIERFVLDTLDTYEEVEFVEAFYEAISGRFFAKDVDREQGIKILDPACGSGAFLFSALNILEPLYERCLERMRGFVENDNLMQNSKTGESRYLHFRSVLEDIDRHPNPRYWIYREIILNNLYGVDLMREAAEIAKLRLFLKLAAEANYDPEHENCGLEPLPDIDYNIRSGNSLVGFASMNQFQETIRDRNELDIDGHHRTIQDKLIDVNKASERFRKSQTQANNFHLQAIEKKALEAKLSELNRSMNDYLRDSYGVNEKEFDKWIDSHNPFHWVAEFYHTIEKSGGFDVVIGNPPYIEYSKVSREYRVLDYSTRQCGNLYAMFIERADQITSDYMGMIVQLPLVCTDRMMIARKILNEYHTYYLNFDDTPSKLFKDLPHIRTSIFLTNRKKAVKEFFSTNYNRWYSECRSNLFQIINLQKSDRLMNYFNIVLKIGSDLEVSIYNKLTKINNRIGDRFLGDHRCYFHKAPGYWIRAFNFIPYFRNERDGEKASGGIEAIEFNTQEKAIATCLIINSTLFYWWYTVVSDCRHLNLRDIDNFPADLNALSEKRRLPKLISIHDRLMENFRKFKTLKIAEYRTTGKVKYHEFHPSHAKAIIDEIDCLLAEHYGFTEEELDYIINFDIKYRMGRQLQQK